MVELEVENTYYEQVTETETVQICDACGEPCEENGGYNPVTVHGDWNEKYDLCENCVCTLDDTSQVLQIAHSTENSRKAPTDSPIRPIIEWTKYALQWARSSIWRFIGVFFALWLGSGLLSFVAEPLGSLLGLILLGWISYEGYRKFSSLDLSGLQEIPQVKDSRVVRQTMNEIQSHISNIGSNKNSIMSNVSSDMKSSKDSDAPFDWYGDTDVDVEEVLDYIDAEIDQETRERIKASVEKHRNRGDAVDAADIRWIAEASEQLDLEGDHS